jgi:hypothetical protein
MPHADNPYQGRLLQIIRSRVFRASYFRCHLICRSRDDTRADMENAMY